MRMLKSYEMRVGAWYRFPKTRERWRFFGTRCVTERSLRDASFGGYGCLRTASRRRDGVLVFVFDGGSSPEKNRERLVVRTTSGIVLDENQNE